MTYSYTQISHYLSCPRRYRHRYLDGWREKDTRPAMLFGRAFELALGAYFRREDPAKCSFANGLLVNIKTCSSLGGTTGIACSSKALCCCIASVKRTALQCLNRNKTCN